jgi:adenylyl- and sulfurtransferase ThiI
LQILDVSPRVLGSFVVLVKPTRTGGRVRDEQSSAILLGQVRERLRDLGLKGKVEESEGALVVTGDEPVRLAEAISRFSGVEAADVVSVVEPTIPAVSKALRDAAMKLVYPRERYRLVVEVGGGSDLSPTDVEFAALAKLIDQMEGRGSKVSERRPDREVRAFVTKSAAYVRYFAYPGFGGLPVGSNGRAVVLFSGGIGSYWAAVDTMKAGLELDLLYLYDGLTPPSHMRRAVAVAALLRESHPTREMRLFAADFDGVGAAIKRSFSGEERIWGYHRAMAAAAARLGAGSGGGWLSSGLTADGGVRYIGAYSAEVAGGGSTFVFPEASHVSEELWAGVNEPRLKAKLRRVAWRLVPAARAATGAHRRDASRAWSAGGMSKLVDEAVKGAFSVELRRGFIDYFGCMDDFAAKAKARGAP